MRALVRLLLTAAFLPGAGISGLPEDEAAATAEVAKTTDGVIFHLWPHGSRIPTGRVTVAQAVGHQPLSDAEYAASHASASPTE